MEAETQPDLDLMSEILRRNDLATGENEVTSDQLKRLLEKEKNRTEYVHYPFEWIIVALAIIGLVA